MAKTARILSENISLVDLVIEILDARIPLSSQNPDFDKLLNNRRRLVLFNKEDLADPVVSSMWKEYYADNTADIIFTDLKTGAGLKTVRTTLKKIGADKAAKQTSKGVVWRPVRAMVIGIPNSGKSTLINMLAGRASAKTEDKPGVTRSKQWIRLSDGIDLLDTPGVLWPKFENDETAENLAFTGAIKDSIMDSEEIAERLLHRILPFYPEHLATRYGIEGDFSAGETGFTLLNAVAKKRGFLLKGGDKDLNRAASAVLDEFRAAKIGRISLERPPM